MLEALKELTHAEIAAYWGAVLSSLMLLSKVTNTYQKRFKLSASALFTSDPLQGHAVTVRNLNNVPIMIFYWEVQYKSKKLFSRTKNIIEAEFDSLDLVIEPHKSTVFSFNETNYFNASKHTLLKERLFITLHIAGRRRPFKIQIY